MAERIILYTPQEYEDLTRTYEGITGRIAFLRAWTRQCLGEGYAPFSGLLLYAQEGILDFTKKKDREIGYFLTTAWALVCNNIIELLDFQTRDAETHTNWNMLKNPPSCSKQLFQQRFQPVIVESPYAGNVAENVAYARSCAKNCIQKGEAPFLSHLLYTQPGILNDLIPAERQWGIDAGLAWGLIAAKTVVYEARGTSRGMQYGIQHAQHAGRPIEYRR